MSISLHLPDLDQLRSLLAGSTQVGGFRVIPGSTPTPYQMQQSIRYMQMGYSADWFSHYLFVASRRYVVGSGSFHAPPSKEGRVELGYEVAPSYRDQGVATAAVGLMILTAFRHPEVVEVFAQCSVNNPASRRVLEKCGLKHLGQAINLEHGPCDQWLIRRF